jgi:hypothetical protein
MRWVFNLNATLKNSVFTGREMKNAKALARRLTVYAQRWPVSEHQARNAIV